MSNPSERSKTAWIPPERAKQMFLQPLPPPEKRLCYTMPGIMSEKSMTEESLIELAKKQKLPVTKTQESVPESLDGVMMLVDRQDLRAAIDLTGNLLTAHGQGFGKAHTPSRHSEMSLKIWCVRLQLLVAIRAYTTASAEMETFADLDAPDLFYQYYPEIYPNRTGCLVPFSLRLLHAELPRHAGNNDELIARCNRLSTVISQILSNLRQGFSEDGTPDAQDTANSTRIWQRRLAAVQHVLARSFVGLKDHALVESVYSALAEGTSDDDCAAIYSLLGRLCIQVGDGRAASECFQKFNAHCDQQNSEMKSLACMHKGFLNVFYGQYAEAQRAFQSAMQYSADSHAANNAATCQLYSARLHDSLTGLEQVCVQSGTEAAVTNLSTLHELASSRSSQRKLQLLQTLVHSKGDAFALGAFKL